MFGRLTNIVNKQTFEFEFTLVIISKLVKGWGDINNPVQFCVLYHQLWSRLYLLAYFPISLNLVCLKLYQGICEFLHLLLRLILFLIIGNPTFVNGPRRLPRNPTKSVRKKCPNTEFFLVCFFQYSDWIQKDTEYLSAYYQYLSCLVIILE